MRTKKKVTKIWISSSFYEGPRQTKLLHEVQFLGLEKMLERKFYMKPHRMNFCVKSRRHFGFGKILKFCSIMYEKFSIIKLFAKFL